MYVEWTDGNNTRAALTYGYITLYGSPGLRRDDGWVSLGVELPRPLPDALVEQIAKAIHEHYQPDEGDDLERAWLSAVRLALEEAIHS